ncbi:MAG: PAS domain S-box protein [Clostridia bacterium]|nr:PAS domain S-box protein [Clostridia bacterium]
MDGHIKYGSKDMSVVEEKLNFAIESLLDSFGIFSAIRDESGTITDFSIEHLNEKVCVRKNFEVQKFIGKKISDFFPLIKENGLLNECITVVETGEPFVKKLIFYENIKGAEQVRYACDIRMVKLDDGIAATWRDITVQKRLEKIDKESKKAKTGIEEELKRLTSFVECSDDAIIGKNAEGYITSWNKGAERIYGYSLDEVIGKHISILAPPGKELEISGILQRIKQGMRISHYETIRKRKDGVLLEVSISISPVFDSEGKVVGASTVARDITAQKQLEKTLVESEERYRLLMDFLPYGVFVHQKGEIIFVNSSCIKMFGANNIYDILGKDFSDFLHQEDSGIVDENNQLDVESDCEVVTKEAKIKKPDGTLLNVETVSTKLNYRSSKAILTVIKDNSAEKKAHVLQKQVEENVKKLNEAIEYDKLKTDFFTNISHELKTPLNIILSSLQLYELLVKSSGQDDNERKIGKLVEVMKQNCYRLLRLINNLIDATRIDAGFYNLYLQNCNIVCIVEDIVMSAAKYTKNKGIEFKFDTEVEEKIIACDPEKIERIMLNLLSNAVKFGKNQGSIFINIYDLGESVALSVKDNGIGIEKDKLDMIFERFRQVDKSLTRNYEGSGIGLSLVKSLTEMHGGTVKVFSEYGKGSEFVVTLPVKKTANTPSYLKRNIINDGTGCSEAEKICIEFSDIYF